MLNDHRASTDQQDRNLIEAPNLGQGESAAFVGAWVCLVSNTNWEKGRIINGWRLSLIDRGSPEADYSDQSWCQLVGGVSPQHVGRLRRTFARFGNVYRDYEGLYWSHFYAALDWDDAEMWLEGGVQNRWTVSQMRNQRWVTLGELPADRSTTGDIVVEEAEEETHTFLNEVAMGGREFISGPIYEGSDFGADESGNKPGRRRGEPTLAALDEQLRTDFLFQPFPNLPIDVVRAGHKFKLAIARHKAGGWAKITLADLLAILDSLKQLAMESLD
jgi:hypothetical protein